MIFLPFVELIGRSIFSGNIGKKGKEKQGLHAVVREGGTSGRCLRGRHARADDLDTWQSLATNHRT